MQRVRPALPELQDHQVQQAQQVPRDRQEHLVLKDQPDHPALLARQELSVPRESPALQEVPAQLEVEEHKDQPEQPDQPAYGEIMVRQDQRAQQEIWDHPDLREAQE